MQRARAWGTAITPASICRDRILVARLDAGTTALAIWQAGDIEILIAARIPRTSWAAVAAHARSHIGDVESEGAETSVACRAPECPVAQSWTPLALPGEVAAGS